MPVTIAVENLDETSAARLAELAARNGRSPQEEARVLLEAALAAALPDLPGGKPRILRTDRDEW